MERQEVDTFLLGVLHLLQTSRHLLLRAAINECYLSAQTLSSTARVHSGVTTTYYEHVLTQVDRCVGSRISRIHQVDTSEVFVRRHDVDSVLTRNTHEVRQTGTRAYEDALEALCLQLFYADGLTYDDVSLEVNTHLGKVLDFHIYNLVRQTELRNTIFQHTTNLMESLKYVDIVALLHHITCKRQTCRA